MNSRALARMIGGLGGWRITRALTSGVPRIFMFHRFGLTEGESEVTAEGIRRFVARVRQECDFVRLSDLMGEHSRKKVRGRPYAIFTVDDGYEDFYRIAAPVLVDLKVPVTVFATAGFVDGRCWLWWDALRFLIERCPSGSIDLHIGGDQLTCNVTDPRDREYAWSQIADRLVTCNASRGEAIAQLEEIVGERLPACPTPDFAPMSWQQLRELVEQDIEIGGHTMTHAYLPGLSHSDLVAEVAEGKKLIESRLGIRLKTFAYPNGMAYDYSSTVEKVVRDAGFEAAVLAFPRPYRSNRRYGIGRWSVHPDSGTVDFILNGASIVRMTLRAMAGLRAS